MINQIGFMKLGGGYGTEPFTIEDGNSMINLFVQRFNQETNNTIIAMNTGRAERTWNVVFRIADGTQQVTYFLNSFFNTLYQAINEYKKIILFIAPAKDPNMSFTPIEKPDDEFIATFAITILNATGGTDQISSFRGTNFDMLLYVGCDTISYIIHFIIL